MIVDYTDFSGGINQRLGPIVDDKVGMTFADDIQNMEGTQYGILKSAGTSAVLSAEIAGTPKIQGIFSYNGTLMFAAAGKVYTVSGSTATQVAALTLDTSAPITAVAFKDRLIIMDGVNAGYTWDGATAAALSMTDPNTIWNSAKPIGAVVARGRIFYWDANKIYTPIAGSYNDFTFATGADAFFCERGFGGNIVGLKGLNNNQIIVYKQNCIRALSGTVQVGSGGDEFQFQFVSDELGAVASGAITQAGLDHYFMSNRGLRKLSLTSQYGVIEVQQPNYVMQETIRGLNFGSAMTYASSVYSPSLDSVYCAVPVGSGTTNTTTLVANVTTGANSLRAGYTADAYYVLNNVLYSGNAGQIYQHGTATDYNGTAISGYWKSKFIAHSGLSTFKQYRNVYLYAEGTGSATFLVRWQVLRKSNSRQHTETQSFSAGSLWGTMVWGVDPWGGGSSSALRIKNPGRGRAIKLEILAQTAASDVKVRQISIEYDPISSVTA